MDITIIGNEGFFVDGNLSLLRNRDLIYRRNGYNYPLGYT